ncbi:hypothetical protein ACJROX_14610 [Pseudalkalibacillus sp. A8]|uniref:hypothetical protein n=1 Tax=Pseudalkalibacillus sp. A8 TaxID=3382641 RepID=UPI0038B60C86
MISLNIIQQVLLFFYLSLSGTYTILLAAGNAIFYFLPIFSELLFPIPRCNKDMTCLWNVKPMGYTPWGCIDLVSASTGGGANAANQLEGSYDLDGKGLSEGEFNK